MQSICGHETQETSKFADSLPRFLIDWMQLVGDPFPHTADIVSLGSWWLLQSGTDWFEGERSSKHNRGWCCGLVVVEKCLGRLPLDKTPGLHHTLAMLSAVQTWPLLPSVYNTEEHQHTMVCADWGGVRISHTQRKSGKGSRRPCCHFEWSLEPGPRKNSENQGNRGGGGRRG